METQNRNGRILKITQTDGRIVPTALTVDDELGRIPLLATGVRQQVAATDCLSAMA